MLAYPGYTISRIRKELSWRKVEVLLKYCADTPPTVTSTKHIEEILSKVHGLTFTKVEEPKKQSVDDLASNLANMGFR